MSPSFLETHSHLDSPIHRLPSAFKLLIALGGVITMVLLPVSRSSFFLAWGVILAGVAVFSKIPPGFLLKRLLLLEPLVLGVSVLALFQPRGGAIFLGILIKSSLCLLTMILLSNTTPFADLLRVLQRLRIPMMLITTLALMHRYLFVLVSEAERMKRARASRTFTPPRSLHWSTLAAVAGQLFVRSTERAERIYAAMISRGWKS